MNRYDVKPYGVHYGEGPVLFLGPHNGSYVPECLKHDGLPLGLNHSWFDAQEPEMRRHEACDWGVQDLFDAMIGLLGDQCSFVWGNYSRLVADLNRLSTDGACFSKISEDTGASIPGNACMEQKDRDERFVHVYQPYMDAVHSMIEEIKERHGGVILLEMHSFTPFFDGKFRDTELGLLKFEDHPVNAAVESFFNAYCKESDVSFLTDYPYTAGSHPTPNRDLSETQSVFYTGIEIRNDCLLNAEGVGTFARVMKALAYDLMFSPDVDLYLRRPKKQD